jgi:hypothetical protein
MKTMGWAALLLGAALAGGCVRDARIAIPADVQARTQRIDLTGMGFGERGDFRLGSAPGTFTRRSLQTRLDDFYVQNIGGGSFDVAAAEGTARLSGRCGFHEEEFHAGTLVAPGMRLAYGCEFARDGASIPGGLLLKEVPTSRSVLAGRTRAGELEIGGLTLQVRAIHDMAGGRVPSGSPLGYAFHLRGRQIGAVDLNGDTKAIFAPAEPGPEREAVLLASLALSVFWDPGE